MTTKLKTALITALTAITLAVPATSAFAGNNWKTTDHHVSSHHSRPHHYIERGRNCL